MPFVFKKHLDEINYLIGSEGKLNISKNLQEILPRFLSSI